MQLLAGSENASLSVGANDDEIDEGMDSGYLPTWKLKNVCQNVMWKHLKAHTCKLQMMTQAVTRRELTGAQAEFLVKRNWYRLTRIHFSSGELVKMGEKKNGARPMNDGSGQPALT